MSNLTVFLGCVLVFSVIASHNHHLTMENRSNGKDANESESVHPTDNILQEISFSPNNSMLCYFLRYISQKKSTDALFISACNQPQTSIRIRAGYLNLVIYEEHKQSFQNDSLQWLEKSNQVEYEHITKPAADDSLDKKLAHEYPDAAKFGVIQDHGFLYRLWLNLATFNNNTSFIAKVTILLLIAILIVIAVFIVYKMKRKEPLLQIEDICLICLDTLESKDKCTLPCTHDFHSKCVVKWFRTNRRHRCPVCRYKVMSTDDNFDHLSDHDSCDEEIAEVQARTAQLEEVLRIVRQNVGLEDLMLLDAD